MLRSVLQPISRFSCYLSAFALGGVAALALPPFSFWPALIPAFSGMLWMLSRSHTGRTAFWKGWWFGFGHFVSGLYWIAHSLLIEPEKFAWMVPFAVAGIPACCAVYTGIATRLVWPLRRTPLALWAAFPVIWVGMEYLRGLLFTGFPWNLTGYAWAGWDALMQPAAVVGVWGLSLFAVLLGGCLYPAWAYRRYPWQYRALAPGVTVLLLLIAGTWGDARLADNAIGEEKAVRGETDIMLRVVQGNIPQQLKWRPAERRRILHTYTALSRQQPGWEQLDILVWPESALPWALQKGERVPYLAQLLPHSRHRQPVLVTGAMRTSQDPSIPEWAVSASDAARPVQYYNSLFVMDSRGKNTAYYDKHHLVPFGEYIPFRHVLPLERITHGMGDFNTGPPPASLAVGRFPPALPLICYEVIFPRIAREPAASRHRPQWQINVTNDAWFGDSSGPYQHLAMARFRAVERGLPLVRAANTGISAVVDAYGRVVKSLPLNTQGVIDVYLPTALPPTPYRTHGDRIPFVLWLLIAVFAGALFRMEQPRPEE